ncbi:MAG: hypothetical protein JXE07_06800 [Candidatus Aminicenantes bacterium]|nr:hypothetical protein [Candidatus Aminicenantes bacterium]
MTDDTVRKMDDLLRKALADDLPPDVAAGMRERIESFRAGKTMREAGPSAAARAWLFGRGVWAALSILLLAAGILLQGKRTSSPLADRISSVKAVFASLETPRR